MNPPEMALQYGHRVESERSERTRIMKRFTGVALWALMLCCFSGCTQYWYQEGKTFAECQQDRDACFKELQKRSDMTGTMTYEFKFMEQCMTEKGYKLVGEDKLPLGARRQEPDVTLQWGMKGIAGEVK
jgi:hypothetical protein